MEKRIQRDLSAVLPREAWIFPQDSGAECPGCEYESAALSGGAFV
jgi:hypothetical protein